MKREAENTCFVDVFLIFFYSDLVHKYDEDGGISESPKEKEKVPLFFFLAF